MFIQCSDLNQLKNKVYQKEFNSMIYQCVGNNQDEFMDNMLPDQNKLRKFKKFFDEKIK